MDKDGSVAAHPAPGFDVDSNPVLRALWTALNDHSGAWVTVIRQDGIVAHANDGILRALGVTARQAIGSHVSEVLPNAIAAERIAYYEQVAQTGVPVCLEGFVGGSLVRCCIRPIPPGPQGGLAHVLCVSRPVGPDAPPPGHPVVRTMTDDLGDLGRLSEREIDVLRLIGRGLTTAQIARELHRSVKTIEWHRVSLGNKLGASNRVELARMAIRFGLASPFDSLIHAPAAVPPDGAK